MKQFYRQLCQIHPFGLGVIEAGFAMMIDYIICAQFALFLAPHAQSYLGMLALRRACLEAAPASFAAGVAAGLICDLALVQEKDRER